MASGFSPSSFRVYPRVGGGTGKLLALQIAVQGLSPRGRGNQLHYLCPRSVERSIPAWAGEPDKDIAIGRVNWVYPRVGGGTKEGLLRGLVNQGLSPRGRGNPVAGKVRYRPLEVYPRVGGGTGEWHSVRCEAKGLSPRGRGNPPQLLGRNVNPGSIPAWAGEPFVRLNDR